MEPSTEVINFGIKNVLSSENIAIVVMFLIIIFQWGLIGVLLNSLLKVKDVLSSLITSITVLNERISHQEDNNEKKG